MRQATQPPGRTNSKVRFILSRILERYDVFASPLPPEWTKMRNYLYHSSERLTVAQVDVVLAMLARVFKNPELEKHILQSTPRILRKNVKTKLQPTIDFLQTIYRDDMFVEAIRRNPHLLLISGTGYDADALELVEFYLRNDLQLSQRQIGRLKSAAPFVFQLPMSKLLSTINYLHSILLAGGMKDDQVRIALARLVVRHPTILQLSLEHNLRPRLTYLRERCGFKKDDLTVLLQQHSAAVLGLSVESNLKPTLDFLTEVLLEKDLRRCLLAHPQLLGLSLANLRTKVAYWDEIDHERKEKRRRSTGLAARFLLRAPAIYSLSLVDSIVPKVEFLAKIWGVNATSGLHSLLYEDPSILTLSLEGNLMPTVNFFNKTGYIHLDSDWHLVHNNKTTILRPRYIAASLFNRLLPRWHYCLGQSQSSPEDITKILPLHVLVSASDEAFCNHIGCLGDDYRRFKKEAIPRLKFSSQFDTWLKTGRPIDT